MAKKQTKKSVIEPKLTDASFTVYTGDPNVVVVLEAYALAVKATDRELSHKLTDEASRLKWKFLSEAVERFADAKQAADALRVKKTNDEKFWEAIRDEQMAFNNLGYWMGELKSYWMGELGKR